MTYYLLHKKTVLLRDGKKSYRNISGKWQKVSYYYIEDFLVGYDSYEHTIDNASIMGEIEEITEEEAIKILGAKVSVKDLEEAEEWKIPH